MNNIDSNIAHERVFRFWIRLTAICLVFSLAYSWRLWLPHAEGYIPPTPVFTWLSVLPDIAGILLYAAIIFSCGVVLVDPGRTRWGYVVWIGLIAICLQDSLRIQPYIMMYGLTFFCLAIFGQERRTLQDWACRVLIAGAYFWSGVQKMNIHFIKEGFPWFTSRFLPDFFPLEETTIFVCIFEAAIGIFILTPMHWQKAKWGAAIMFGVVIACLGPFGHNWNAIVWPWNVWILFAVLVFCDHRAKGTSPSLGDLKSSVAFWFIAISVLVMPGVGYFGHWPPYLSFKLYSCNVTTGEILLGESEQVETLPTHLQKLVGKTKSIDVNPYAVQKYHVVPSMIRTDDPLLFNISQTICPYLKRPEQAKLVTKFIAGAWTLKKVEKDRFLCNNIPDDKQ